METGRWERIAREDRLCLCDQGVVETEWHVVTECQNWEDERENLCGELIGGNLRLLDFTALHWFVWVVDPTVKTRNAAGLFLLLVMRRKDRDWALQHPRA